MARELGEVVYVDGVRTAFGRAGPKGFFMKVLEFVAGGTGAVATLAQRRLHWRARTD